jgi:hypothetical protein
MRCESAEWCELVGSWKVWPATSARRDRTGSHRVRSAPTSAELDPGVLSAVGARGSAVRIACDKECLSSPVDDLFFFACVPRESVRRAISLSLSSCQSHV